ncbi:MAG: hypothetical protein ACOX2O_01615 [Bdellovibrionota bacterium]|jgi:Flp pilus assembly pilin Flp
MSENKMIEELLEVQEEKREKGATMVEYAIMVIVIFVIVYGGMKFFGTSMSATYSQAGTTLETGKNQIASVTF